MDKDDRTISQYNDVEFEMGKPVPARYIEASLDMDKGNIFIEALPLPRTEREIELAYDTELPSYSSENIEKMSRFQRMMCVGQLKSIRFNLPFHEQLEFEFYNALIQSYRARELLVAENGVLVNHINNEPQKNSGILVGNSARATNAGFSLIGYSGCGKSSAIEILVSHYPQVIIHKINGGYFPQITYLVVNCVANSNFTALYEGIGDAIDKALGNVEPIYAEEIKKTRNLGIKAEKVREYVEKFAIGAIIFDEIQLIDFEHTKENTFDSLLTLANKTKTAIIVVGTEDAKDKMFSELRTSRRLGMMINGNAYCNNKRFFNNLVEELFYYQWFDKQVEVTQDICDTLYDLTKGIIDQLVSLYSAAHIDYLSSRVRPEVNGEYFKKIAKKYYPGIQDVLANLESTENIRKRNEICKSADNLMKTMLDQAKQNEKAEELIGRSRDKAERTITLSNVVAAINGIYDFSDDQIQAAYKKVMARNTSENKNEKEITRLVIEELNKIPSKNRKKKITPSEIDDFRSFLGIDKAEAL